MSIEEIIERLDKMAQHHEICGQTFALDFPREKYQAWGQTLREAIALLRTHPDNQQGKPQRDGWISVDDGRPEYCENVLVYYAGDGINHPRVSESFRMYDEVFLLESVYGPVTHWRPLPEPPKDVQ